MEVVYFLHATAARPLTQVNQQENERKKNTGKTNHFDVIHVSPTTFMGISCGPHHKQLHTSVLYIYTRMMNVTYMGVDVFKWLEYCMVWIA